jgi:CPA1 family monovalent cation:H+ antiporter
MDNSLVIAEEVLIGLLLVASLVAIFMQRFRLPYTVGLVVIGLLFTAMFDLPQEVAEVISNSPAIILSLLVPPLIFEAAFHLRMEDLRRDLGLILLLAVPGVILSTMVVGWIVSLGTGIALQLAMVFGALIAATDPVAVVALFRRLGAPKRLQVLLEGESLFNDGTAIVMFNIVLAIAGISLGHGVGSTLTANSGIFGWIAEFVRVAGGGVATGIILGMFASQIIGRIDDPLVETTLTTVLAFGSYLVGEHLLGVSGVLAVVAAGIVNGNVGPRGMSATTRVVVFNFWEYAAFLANSVIFLLIGLTIDITDMVSDLPAIGVAIFAVLVARALGIYGFSLFSREISTKWKHVMYWGGLRGAIALALVLTIPSQVEQVETLRNMAFGVVLFTLLGQGISMDRLIKVLKLVQRSELQEEYERRHARFVAARSAYDYIRRMSQQGLISEHTWQRLAPLMEKQNEAFVEAIRVVVTSDPAVEAEELDTARREALRAQRSALTGLLRDSVISEETYSQLVSEVDVALSEQNLSWPELIQYGTRKDIKQLIAAIIQEQDLESVQGVLGKLGYTVTQLPSTGGFLSQKNVTLLIGIPKGQTKAAVKALQTICNKRVATIFTFDVESYDEF